MKKIAFAFAMLALTITPSITLAQNTQVAPKTTLEFTQEQLQMLGQALLNLPKKDADPFIADLNKQISDQQKVAAEKKTAEDKKLSDVKKKENP